MSIKELQQLGLDTSLLGVIEERLRAKSTAKSMASQAATKPAVPAHTDNVAPAAVSIIRNPGVHDASVPFSSLLTTKSAPDELDPEIEQLLQEYLNDPDAGQQPLALQMWDFGGQKLFLMLHHLFLEPDGVYLVVFNGQELVLPPGERLEGLPERITTDATRRICIEHLSNWLNSIYMHAPGSPVFIVCTCLDKLTKEQQQDIGGILLDEVLVKTSCWDQVEPPESDDYCFFVNNTDSQDASVNALRDHVETVVNDLDHIRIRMPISWLRVLDRVSELIAQKDSQRSQRCTRSEFVELAAECGLGRTHISLQNEVDGLLFKFHTLGLLAWYDTPIMRDVVVSFIMILGPERWYADEVSFLNALLTVRLSQLCRLLIHNG